MTWRYTLEQPPLGTLQARCGHCDQTGALVRHNVIAVPENEPPTAQPSPQGEALVCPACKEASRPASRAARIFAIAVFGPATLATLYGLARGLSTLYDVARGELQLGVGRIVMMVLLLLAGSWLSYRALRIVIRALSRVWLLPLKDLTGKAK
jgi:hypothetical protein